MAHLFWMLLVGLLLWRALLYAVREVGKAWRNDD